MATLAVRLMSRKRHSHGRRRRRGGGKAKKIKENSQPSFPNIPEEIVFEILSRLPPNSLSRFVCVSKQWRSLISYIFAKTAGRQMVLIESGDSLYSMDQKLHVEQVYEPWKEVSPIICGSSNGLLLMRVDEDLFLWNPLTRYFKKVLSYQRLQYDPLVRVVSGLCHDYSTDNYKAVMVLLSEGCPCGCNDYDYVVVGSFRSKTWTHVDFPYNARSLDSGPVVNGNLHWFASKGFSYPHQIFYFNPIRDEFHKVPMPQPKDTDRDIVLGLGALDGCLCMSRLETPNNNGRNVEVLVMKEYGMEQSWTVLFIISIPALSSTLEELVPLCYTRSGETLMKARKFIIDNDCLQLWAYNPKDHSCRKIVIGNEYYVDQVAYEESLVIPIGYDWEEKEMKGEATYMEYFLHGSPDKLKKGMDGSWEHVKLEEGDHVQSSSKEEFKSSSDESDFGD